VLCEVTWCCVRSHSEDSFNSSSSGLSNLGDVEDTTDTTSMFSSSLSSCNVVLSLSSHLINYRLIPNSRYVSYSPVELDRDIYVENYFIPVTNASIMLDSVLGEVSFKTDPKTSRQLTIFGPPQHKISADLEPYFVSEYKDLEPLISVMNAQLERHLMSNGTPLNACIIEQFDTHQTTADVNIIPEFIPVNKGSPIAIVCFGNQHSVNIVPKAQVNKKKTDAAHVSLNHGTAIFLSSRTRDKYQLRTDTRECGDPVELSGKSIRITCISVPCESLPSTPCPSDVSADETGLLTNNFQLRIAHEASYMGALLNCNGSSLDTILRLMSEPVKGNVSERRSKVLDIVADETILIPEPVIKVIVKEISPPVVRSELDAVRLVSTGAATECRKRLVDYLCAEAHKESEVSSPRSYSYEPPSALKHDHQYMSPTHNITEDPQMSFDLSGSKLPHMKLPDSADFLKKRPGPPNSCKAKRKRSIRKSSVYFSIKDYIENLKTASPDELSADLQHFQLNADGTKKGKMKRIISFLSGSNTTQKNLTADCSLALDNRISLLEKAVISSTDTVLQVKDEVTALGTSLLHLDAHNPVTLKPTQGNDPDLLSATNAPGTNFRCDFLGEIVRYRTREFRKRCGTGAVKISKQSKQLSN
jgi:hypothetical protein